ncbi:MAG: amidase [Actinomycetota bacterium]|nr:amidase [Acidimicrobiales bacterium]
MLSGVTELAEAFRNGSSSPSKAVEQCLAKIAEVDSSIKAWQSVFAEEALAAAKIADQAFKSGEAQGPFVGIPFALKDIVEVEGKIATAGCAERQNIVSDRSADVAKLLLQAGGILVGKTKTVEFAFGGWGTNQHMGTPLNPWDLQNPRTPGGSSSGSGAAVSSGMIPCAIGTDTGGSVRLPAAFCGIVGLKTTKDLISTDGIVPLSHTLDTPGPLARSVNDAALMFLALTGASGPQDYENWLNKNGIWSEVTASIAELRMCSLGEREREGVDAEVLESYDESIEDLRRLGAKITPLDPPKPFEELKEANGIITTAEGYFYHGDLMANPDSQVDEHVRQRFLAGVNLTAKDYISAIQKRVEDQKEFFTSIANADAYLTPTTPMLPLPLDGLNENETPARFTRPGNYLNMCGISVPGKVSKTNLPTALQILCRPNEEALTLRIAAAYETQRGALADPPGFAGT